MSKERIYCNACKGETWHESVSHHEYDRHDYFWGSSQRFVTDTFKCCGCEDITFRLIKNPFEFQDTKDEPEKFLYQETIAAHNNELTVLSTVGIRSLIEAIVADKIDASKYKNNLESKIDALKPFFQVTVINVLYEFRTMGNKAAHELEAPE